MKQTVLVWLTAVKISSLVDSAKTLQLKDLPATKERTGHPAVKGVAIAGIPAAAKAAIEKKIAGGKLGMVETVLSEASYTIRGLARSRPPR
jgi:hypothetical protein